MIFKNRLYENKLILTLKFYDRKKEEESWKNIQKILEDEYAGFEERNYHVSNYKRYYMLLKQGRNNASDILYNAVRNNVKFIMNTFSDEEYTRHHLNAAIQANNVPLVEKLVSKPYFIGIPSIVYAIKAQNSKIIDLVCNYTKEDDKDWFAEWAVEDCNVVLMGYFGVFDIQDSYDNIIGYCGRNGRNKIAVWFEHLKEKSLSKKK